MVSVAAPTVSTPSQRLTVENEDAEFYRNNED
jgi:hypothetical protein